MADAGATRKIRWKLLNVITEKWYHLVNGIKLTKSQLFFKESILVVLIRIR
jgi:hypothetical protein